DRLLGPTTRQEPPPARPQRPDPAHQAERPLPPVQGPALARRPRAIQPHRVGTMAPGHPQGDHQAAPDHPAGHGHIGRHPPGPLALPAPGNRRPETTSTPLRLSAPGACLSRMPRRVARTDLRGPRCSNASGLPGYTRDSTSVNTVVGRDDSPVLVFG